MYNFKIYTHRNYGIRKKHFIINTNDDEPNLPN